jgi:hypothetical protein
LPLSGGTFYILARGTARDLLGHFQYDCLEIASRD